MIKILRKRNYILGQTLSTATRNGKLLLRVVQLVFCAAGVVRPPVVIGRSCSAVKVLTGARRYVITEILHNTYVVDRLRRAVAVAGHHYVRICHSR